MGLLKFDYWTRLACTKNVRGQKDVGPLISSQEERAAVIPQINRSSTARQPLVNLFVVFLDSAYKAFCLFVTPRRRPGGLSSMSWATRWTAFSPESTTRRRPTPPRLAQGDVRRNIRSKDRRWEILRSSEPGDRRNPLSSKKTPIFEESFPIFEDPSYLRRTPSSPPRP